MCAKLDITVKSAQRGMTHFKTEIDGHIYLSVCLPDKLIKVPLLYCVCDDNIKTHLENKIQIIVINALPRYCCCGLLLKTLSCASKNRDIKK